MPRELHSPRYDTLREVLINERIKAGITQAVLAEKLQRSQSFVSKFEIGVRHLDVIEFIDVCKAMGVDPRVILGKVAR